MLSLMRRAMRRPTDDRGAIGVLVTVLVGAGVVLGMATMVVDVSEIYVERSELQNGADAGAMAVLKACANRPTCSDPGAPSIAKSYADQNAYNDGQSAVDLICGRVDSLDDCPDPGSTERLVDCHDPAPENGEYAEVHTSTQTDGGPVLPTRFAHALAGNEGFAGSKTGACARAKTGGLVRYEGLALTISWCEWKKATDSGNKYADPPPAVPGLGYETVLYFHSNSTTNPSGGTACTAGPSGADISGGFGMTDPEDGTCTTDVDLDPETGDPIYGADPGTSVSDTKQCGDALLNAWTTHDPVTIPVYIGTQAGANGNNGTYELSQPAAFVVTGYNLGGQVKNPGWLAGPYLNKLPCNGRERCMSGYFTTDFTNGEVGDGECEYLNCGIKLID